jgi:hypothetical protein
MVRSNPSRGIVASFLCIQEVLDVVEKYLQWVGVDVRFFGFLRTVELGVS